MNTISLLYFSLNCDSVNAFCRFVESKRLNYKHSFRIINEKDDSSRSNVWKAFNHASDIVFFLDTLSGLSNLYVIVDYISLCNERSGDTSDSAWRAADIIRRVILKYPEVFFLFDESWRSGLKACKEDFIDFLFRAKDEVIHQKLEAEIQKVFRELHQFDIMSPEPFAAVARERKNLFDGSNLRYAIKLLSYWNLHVNEQNFNRIQESRSKYLAVCVEEDRAQNRFNSYALYANGVRVLSVTSAQELQFINESADSLKPNVIVRDYDLQFSDAPGDLVKSVRYVKSNGVTDSSTAREISMKDFLSLNPQIDKNVYKIQGTIESIINKDKGIFTLKDPETETVVKIRGHKLDGENKGEPLTVSGHCGVIDYYTIDFIRGYKLIDEPLEWENLLADINQKYWSNLSSKPIFFISKGVPSVVLDRRINSNAKISTDHSILTLNGCAKPVTGCFRQFHGIRINDEPVLKLEDVYEESVRWKDEWRNDQRKKYYLDTTREGHSHGVPLDLYDLAKSMLVRADDYLKREKYVLSAVLSEEVIEILNGFHESMMLKAYHIHVVSENAITMRLLGGSETELMKDAVFRIEKICSEVKRMLARKGYDEKRMGLETNVLNQIFSDCRHYCKEKEHFGAEGAFISAMAHNSEGFTVSELLPFIRRRVARKDEEFVTIHESLLKAEEESYKNYLLTSITKISQLLSFKNDSFRLAHEGRLEKRLEKLKKSYVDFFEKAIDEPSHTESLMLEQGDRIRLKLIKHDKRFSQHRGKIIWGVDNERIVSVKNGVVHALEVGEVTVTAELNQTSSSIKIIVSRKTSKE